MWAFCKSVPFWVGPGCVGGFSRGLSVRLSWLAGAGKSSAFCECAAGVVADKQQCIGAFCEVALAGIVETGVKGLGVKPLSRRGPAPSREGCETVVKQGLQVVHGWGVKFL